MNKTSFSQHSQVILNLCGKIECPVKRGHCLVRLAEAAAALGRWEELPRFIGPAIVSFKDIQEPLESVFLSCRCAELLHSMSEFDEAFNLLAVSLKKITDPAVIKNNELRTQALEKIASAYLITGELEFAEAALSHEPDQLKRIFLLADLGTRHKDDNRIFHPAINRAQQSAESLEDHLGFCKAMLFIAERFNSASMMHQALESLKKVVERSGKIRSVSDRADVLLGTAGIWAQVEPGPEAGDLLKLSCHEVVKVRDANQRLRMFQEAAMLSRTLGDDKRCIRIYAQSLKPASREHSFPETQRMLQRWLEILPTEAIPQVAELFADLHNCIRKEGDPAGTALSLASLATAAGKIFPDQSAGLLREGLQLVLGLPDPEKQSALPALLRSSIAIGDQDFQKMVESEMFSMNPDQRIASEIGWLYLYGKQLADIPDLIMLTDPLSGFDIAASALEQQLSPDSEVIKRLAENMLKLCFLMNAPVERCRCKLKLLRILSRTKVDVSLAEIAGTALEDMNMTIDPFDQAGLRIDFLLLQDNIQLAP
ncbi:MAG: hypothetical protein PHQ23_14625 [Candidatus Wallbacteria bacterium]|nr:hypothetical protein [Candidatus Wallbacteria bacterium]